MPILGPANRGFRYGEGVFETMKVGPGGIQLAELHFERFFSGLRLLRFNIPPELSRQTLSAQIQSLSKQNHPNDLAKIRLVGFRGSAAPGEEGYEIPQYIIESSALPRLPTAIDEASGLSIDIFSEGRKSMDMYSNLKSNNYLIYSMAAEFAHRRKLDDCLVLNNQENVCDSSIANVFCIKDHRLFTPPLSEGPVAGVMRRFIVEKVNGSFLQVNQVPIDRVFLLSADEIFLTNAIRGIRPVRSFGEKPYAVKETNQIARELQKILSQNATF